MCSSLGSMMALGSVLFAALSKWDFLWVPKQMPPVSVLSVCPHPPIVFSSRGDSWLTSWLFCARALTAQVCLDVRVVSSGQDCTGMEQGSVNGLDNPESLTFCCAGIYNSRLCA